MTEYDKQVCWITQLAQEPAWAAYAKGRAMELEQTWPGITAEIRAEIKRQKSSTGRRKGGDCE